MSTPLIALRQVSAGYAGRPVLVDADLSLMAGERLVLLGPNGAGKSTLLHVIAGLLPISAGSIEAFGVVRKSEADFHEVRIRAGLVFQDSDDQLFCPTVVEDVAFGPLNLGHSDAAARKIALETLERVGMADFAERVTHRLSGGEKRLIAIASVLAMQPQVLLLDEPTTGLDDVAYERLCRLLLSLDQAMILVSHDPRFAARLATRTVTLRDGRVVEAIVHTHEHRHVHTHIHVDDDHHHS